MANKDQANNKFESALEELEGVIEQLESGNLSLEDSLAAFEKGVGLVKFCNQKLSEVEKKVELLIRDKEGKLQLKLLGSLADREEKEEAGD
jgi:exodeoxyribonuclease VII small subunit